MFAPLRNNVRTLRSLLAGLLVLVFFAMQSMVALHRTLHASHASHAQETANHDHSASTASDRHDDHLHIDHSDHEHDPHHHDHAFDPWAHHADAADCERFDASLAANPVTPPPNHHSELRVGRADATIAAAAAVALRAQRARVRDPPPS